MAVESGNPKDVASRSKVKLAIIPPTAEVLCARVLQHGAEKYGYWNWRGEKIEYMGYLSAIRRHLSAIVSGEDVDPESGMPHIAHVMATASILIDAAAAKCIIDDRPKKLETD